MGNSLGGRKTAKVMKIDGETFKLTTPARVADVLKDHPGHVLMESEAVRHLGVRAKPLDADHAIKPKRLYFLVQLPEVRDPKGMRKVRSGIINMNAKDRLENLMLSKRSISDLSHVTSVVGTTIDGQDEGGERAVRVKMRLPKAQVAKLVEESKDAAEAAEKIMKLCIGGTSGSAEDFSNGDGNLAMQQRQWKPALGSITESCKAKEKFGVRFLPIQEVSQA
ncbi:uncharacterized protein At1g66480-like [Magnolia sinica]|uniref:uncharacterized protein At1g66480-like n=1 Tax=Magnolia sinica TaxID=86752 RepID=UPI00265A13E0|nr:uncharacterized protein At1g66480-like [Magnolia sinica]